MLDELRVTNLGIISEARLTLGPGLTAVTGETGTGKTLLLGALRLLRGDTARSDRIGPAGEDTTVEGRFLTPTGEELIAARRITSGRSRAYLDGVMATATALEEQIGPLTEIVGQHDHLTIGKDRAVRSIVDGLLDAEGRDAAVGYRAAWDGLRSLLADQQALGGDPHAVERELDLARHQADEIAAAGIDPEADAGLVAGIDRLRHGEEIAEALSRAHGALGDDDGALEAAGRALDAIRRASALDPSLAPVEQALADLIASIAELSGELVATAADLDRDPAALATAEDRVAALRDLRRKYGETLEEVVAYGAAASSRADELTALAERASTLEQEIAAARSVVATAGERLLRARRTAGKELAAAAIGHLRHLGFRDPVVEIELSPADPGPSGADRLGLLFASDSSLQPGPVGRIASGGELSRLVLAVRLASGVGEAPIVAFDEIDAGIGGATALAMGEKLASLAAGRQVLVVTHLPQVAAFADAHFVVDRTGGRAAVRPVVDGERVEELSRMLGGLPESERGREHAAELVALAADRRS